MNNTLRFENQKGGGGGGGGGGWRREKKVLKFCETFYELWNETSHKVFSNLFKFSI